MSRYGLFCYGSFAYAVPLLRMRKVIHRCSGYRLPRLPAVVVEILIDEDQLVPLIALPASVVGENLSARTVEYKVLVESEAGRVAFPAEVTCGIVAERKGDLLDSDGEQISGIAGIFKYQETEYKILDIDLLAVGLTQQV